MKDPKTLLGDYISAVAGHVFTAERAYHIYREIGLHAEAVNSNNFGSALGYVQAVLVDHFGLSITKVFERYSKRNDTRSIPSALTYLEQHADALQVYTPPRLYDRLISLGAAEDTRALSGSALTHRIVVTYRAALPDTSKTDHCALSASLQAWRTRRDKRTVHDEAIPAEAIPNVTWAESQQLLDYAKGFVGTIGWAYLSTAYEVEGEFLLDGDAQRDGIAFARLFGKASLNRALGHALPR